MFWESKEGEELLRDATELYAENGRDSSKTSLRLKSLRSSNSPAQLNRALEIVVARDKLSTQGEWTRRGLFTKQGAEQASHPSISAHHAARFQGCRNVLEVCGGLGFDTVALARVAHSVTTIEADSETAEMLSHNLAVQGISNVTVMAGKAEDIIGSISLDEFDALFADPSRRTTGGDRISNPNHYAPPLSFLLSLPISGPRGIKISPSVNLDPMPGGWSREWLGIGEECLEQTLWYNTEVVDGSASLPSAGASWNPRGEARSEIYSGALSDLAGYHLIEPHGTLIRTGWLDTFCTEHGFSMLDPRIAYAVSPSLPELSPWWTIFRIIDSFPYNLKALSQKIESLGWSRQTEIKKRGIDIDPDLLRKKLPLLPASHTTPHGVIILTRIGSDHWAFLGERERSKGGEDR